jgi:hypothetical protein
VSISGRLCRAGRRHHDSPPSVRSSHCARALTPRRYPESRSPGVGRPTKQMAWPRVLCGCQIAKHDDQILSDASGRPQRSPVPAQRAPKAVPVAPCPAPPQIMALMPACLSAGSRIGPRICRISLVMPFAGARLDRGSIISSVVALPFEPTRLLSHHHVVCAIAATQGGRALQLPFIMSSSGMTVVEGANLLQLRHAAAPARTGIPLLVSRSRSRPSWAASA